jgi:hypothetical protein
VELTGGVSERFNAEVCYTGGRNIPQWELWIEKVGSGGIQNVIVATATASNYPARGRTPR